MATFRFEGLVAFAPLSDRAKGMLSRIGLTGTKVASRRLADLLKYDNYLLVSAMDKSQVTCSLLNAFETKPSFVWHERLGAFESDWHQHPKGQLMYAENGCIHVNIEGKRLLLPSWYCAWVPPDNQHFIWSSSPALFIRTVYMGQGLEKHPVFAQPCVFPVSALLREMIGYTERWHKAPATEEEAVFLQALQNLLPREMTGLSPVCLPSTDHPKLVRMLEYLQAHLPENISAEALASEFGMSTRTLTRLFDSQLGISFSRYSKIARAIQAMELIEKGMNHVSAIADRVGYESVSTFSNNFLEIWGSRPLSFIEKKRA